MRQLLPCPFCGQKPVPPVAENWGDGYNWFIRCDCGAMMRVKLHGFNINSNKDEVVTKWNRRRGNIKKTANKEAPC